LSRSNQTFTGSVVKGNGDLLIRLVVAKFSSRDVDVLKYVIGRICKLTLVDFEFNFLLMFDELKIVSILAAA
jgi:hypothetical protein